MNTITLKQNCESMGLNSIDRRIEKTGDKISLIKIVTNNNPFKQEIREWKLNYAPNWNNEEFLWNLKELINN